MKDLSTKKALIVGFGAIAQGLLPLLISDVSMKPENIVALSADENGSDIASRFGITYLTNSPLTQENYFEKLDALFDQHKFDIIINLSVDVSSTALIEYATIRNCLYIDTCVEPWAGGYQKDGPASTNHILRERALSINSSRLFSDPAPTAVIAHGANPGLVSHFVKKALGKVFKDRFPFTKREVSLAEMAFTLGLKAIHIAERDTQTTNKALLPNQFRNTWSCHGFMSELFQKTEISVGSHELDLGNAIEHCSKYGKAVLNTRGAESNLKSWVRSCGEQLTLALTHHESLSISDMLESISDSDSYRPTVVYAYRPSDVAYNSAMEYRFNGYKAPEDIEVLKARDVNSGFDELGVLLIFDRGESFWYGSQLSIETAKLLAPFNTATTLQVTASVLAAIMWMFENNKMGVVEAEDIDLTKHLRYVEHYLGNVVGVYTDWKPENCQFKLE